MGWIWWNLIWLIRFCVDLCRLPCHICNQFFVFRILRRIWNLRWVFWILDQPSWVHPRYDAAREQFYDNFVLQSMLFYRRKGHVWIVKCPLRSHPCPMQHCLAFVWYDLIESVQDQPISASSQCDKVFSVQWVVVQCIESLPLHWSLL